MFWDEELRHCNAAEGFLAEPLKCPLYVSETNQYYE